MEIIADFIHIHYWGRFQAHKQNNEQKFQPSLLTPSLSPSLQWCTHTCVCVAEYIYIYIYICVCVCECCMFFCIVVNVAKCTSRMSWLIMQPRQMVQFLFAAGTFFSFCRSTTGSHTRLSKCRKTVRLKCEH